MRGALGQIAVVARLSLTSMRERLGSSLVIVLGTTCVVAVLLSMLSVNAGLMRVYATASDPARAIVWPANTQDEFGTDITRSGVGTILDAPGIAKSADGRALADAQFVLLVPPLQGWTESGYLHLRGIGPAGFALRPEIHIVAGRLFESGQQELLVGEGALGAYGLKVGDKVILPDGDWPIVGAFAGGGVLEGELLADADTIMASARKGGFGSVLVKLESPAAFDTFQRWLAENPALGVIAEKQSDYYFRKVSGYTSYLKAMAYIVGGIMSIGALLGSINILYAVVAARTREVATLRALGYEAVPVAVSIVLEAMMLSLIGAVVGACIAWLLFDGRQTVTLESVHELSVSAGLVALGFAWALVLALLGSVFPALRAARLPVAHALRAS